MSGSLSTVFQPHPFQLARIDAQTPAGLTIAEIVATANLSPVQARHARVWINDWEVSPDLWKHAKPKGGTVVYIKVFPAKGGGGSGGGKNPMATVLTLAVMVAAPYLGGALANAMGLAGFTIGGTAITAAQMFSAGISLIGGALINSIVGTPAPPRPEAALGNNVAWGQTSPDFKITGTSNRLQPYAPIPRVFGRCRIYPLIAARPYTETLGSARYVRLLLLAGYGPLKISDLRIGETPLSAFSGVEVEIDEGGPDGWAGNAPITLYTRAIREDSLNVALTEAGGWQMRTTRTDTAEISLDVSWPRGLIHYDSSGGRSARTIVVEVQYRAVGGVDWLTPTWLNSADTGLEVDGTITATETTQSGVQRGAHWAVATPGQYEVRVRRTTTPGTDHDVDETVWSALRSIQNEPPVRMKGVTLIAVRIKASEQLNGVPDSINCIAESYHQAWNGSAWNWQLTRNPAWHSVDLLRRRGQKTLMADSRIDLDTYVGYATACDAAPPNGSGPYWVYDGVIEGGSIYSALHDVLSHGRASYSMKDAKHSVVWDRVQSVPAQHISPRNSWGFSGSKKFLDLPHALHVKFTNADKGYKEDVCTVYADGYTENNATRFETVEYYGCTRSDQAWRIGRYLLAVGRLRPEKFSCYLDIESLRCLRSDLVHFAHNVIEVGLGSGRIRGVTVAGGSVTAITLDGQMEMAVGKSYGVRVRRSDGQSIVLAVVTEFGAHEVLTLATPILEAVGPEPGDLFLFGEAGIESMPCIVEKIERGPNLTAKLTLVDYAPGVLTADSGVIPAFTSWITSGVSPKDQAPNAPAFTLRSDKTALTRAANGAILDRIAVTVAAPPSGLVPAEDYEIRYRETGSTVWSASQRLNAASGTLYLSPVIMGAAYDVAVRALSRYGTPSAWVQADPHTVIGKSEPPGDIPWAALNNGVLTWGMPDEIDLKLTRWRWQPGNNRNWADANTFPDGDQIGTSWTPNAMPFGQVTLLAKAVDTLGNESVSPAAIVTDLGDPLVANVIATTDYHALGFPGTVVNGATTPAFWTSDADPFWTNDADPFWDTSGDLFATADPLPLFWTSDSAPFWTNDADPFWLAQTFAAMSYTTPVLYIEAQDVGSQITLNTVIDAASYLIEYRQQNGTPFWTNDADPFWTSDADPFWKPGAWQSWPGSLTAQLDGYQFRVTTTAGQTEGRVRVLKVLLDVPDIRETLADVSISAAGTRLPVTKSYRNIAAVHLTLQADGGSARGGRVEDKLNTGPLVSCRDGANAWVSGKLDAIVEGY